MAFASADLTLLSYGNGHGLYFHDANSSSDTLATVAAAGYYNNTDDNLNLAAGDQIMVKATNGNAVLEVVSVSSGSVTTRDISVSAVQAGTTTQNLPATGIVTLGSTTAGTHNLAPPTAGDRLTVINTGVAGNHIVTTTASVIFGSGSGTEVILPAIGVGVELLALSSTHYLIVGDIVAPRSTTAAILGYSTT